MAILLSQSLWAETEPTFQEKDLSLLPPQSRYDQWDCMAVQKMEVDIYGRTSFVFSPQHFAWIVRSRGTPRAWLQMCLLSSRVRCPATLDWPAAAVQTHFLLLTTVACLMSELLEVWPPLLVRAFCRKVKTTITTGSKDDHNYRSVIFQLNLQAIINRNDLITEKVRQNL